MVDKVSAENMSSDLRHLYALKDFVASQHSTLDEKLVKKYAAVLEKYFEEHENDIGGWSYSIKKKLSGHIKSIEQPIFKIYLNRGDFSDYWDGLFNGTSEEMMPEWADRFRDNINALYNSLKDIGDINSAFLENFDINNAAAEASIPVGLKEMENYLVDEKVYSKYKEDIPYALDRYNRNVQALVKSMDDVGVSRESTGDAADAVKESIDKSNQFFKVLINGSDDRKTVLQGALLLKDSLNEVQKTVNVCLTDRDENFDLDNLYLRNLETGSFMSMLYRLKNIDKQELKMRTLESLGFEIEGVVHSIYPYVSGLAAVRKNEKQ
ncbi:MAG: hypothetical protein KAS11_02510 [Candidatus Aenigmarchaeota archaeon]|nr:hypothetical protein [Candidatus Aenigmarchaeota archaeon]